MKIIQLFLFLLHMQTLFAQEGTVSNCNHCGKYAGKSDNIENGKTNHIYAKLSLYEDSSYAYEIGGVFPFCTSKTLIGAGKWFLDSDWLYFKPDTNESGIATFVMRPINTDEELNKTEVTNQLKNRQNGYDYSLKITKDGSMCDKIFFKISWDCFKSNWTNKFIQKTNCR